MPAKVCGARGFVSGNNAGGVEEAEEETAAEEEVVVAMEDSKRVVVDDIGPFENTTVAAVNPSTAWSGSSRTENTHNDCNNKALIILIIVRVEVRRRSARPQPGRHDRQEAKTSTTCPNRRVLK